MIEAFETYDIYLAATLYALRFELLEINRSDPRRAVFRFEGDGQITYVSEAFYGNQIKMNPREVLWGLKEVKSRLYGGTV